MKECSKSIARRMADANFIRRYFVGEGVDIGGKPDPLALYREMFPGMSSVRTWDWEDGDAQFLAGVADGTFDFVHSSHCLEHLVDPRQGLQNWFRVVREGGYLVCSVPDEDLYEQGIFPSTFNRDHKWTFTVWKARSWSTKSINLMDLIRGLDEQAELVRMEVLNSTYRFDLPRFDQTLTPVGECGIEFVIRKRPVREVVAGGRLPTGDSQPDPDIRRHYNQYRDDLTTLKKSNSGQPPFTNTTPL